MVTEDEVRACLDAFCEEARALIGDLTPEAVYWHLQWAEVDYSVLTEAPIGEHLDLPEAAQAWHRLLWEYGQDVDDWSTCRVSKVMIGRQNFIRLYEAGLLGQQPRSVTPEPATLRAYAPEPATDPEVPPPVDPDTLPPWVTVRQAAALLRITIKQVYKRIDKRRIPDTAVKREGKPGTHLRLNKAAILAYYDNLPAARVNARGIDLNKGRKLV